MRRTSIEKELSWILGAATKSIDEQTKATVSLTDILKILVDKINALTELNSKLIDKTDNLIELEHILLEQVDQLSQSKNKKSVVASVATRLKEKLYEIPKRDGITFSQANTKPDQSNSDSFLTK